jgi:4-amino-4-deoxy-L-arabinose transferase-like glycosyltransferase
MPFVSALGLSPFAVRLPMALMGTITVAAIAVYAKTIGGKRIGLASAFF